LQGRGFCTFVFFDDEAMTFTQILSKFKYSILFVLSFVLLENLAWIIEPTFFGNLLDALIDRFYAKEKVDYSIPLLIWIAIYLLNVLGGTLHRYFSGKIYPTMYANITTSLIISSRQKRHPASKIFARTELAKEYIVFLKERLPEVTWQLCATFGAIIALFFYDWRIAGVALLVVFPVAFINDLYRRVVINLQKDIHDSREDQYKVIEDKNTERIQEYYFSMIRPQVKIAKWSSWDFLIIKVLLMIIFIVILFICVDVDNFSTGKIYAIVSYIWTFIASTDYLPGLMESLTSVRELSTRLAEETKDTPAEIMIVDETV
jgi:ABC-type multidrug transport system fused ATPase/permease subunit